jgi:hypothetical protein
MAVRQVAGRQRALARLFERAGNSGFPTALVWSLPWEEQAMRWKISHRGHDPRQLDLVAVLALVIIVAACRYFSHSTTDMRGHASFIVPSQSVRW